MSDDQYFQWTYAAEKFMVATDALATSFGPNWQRMHSAISAISLLRREDVPDNNVWSRIEKLLRMASKFGPRMSGDRIVVGSYENTLRRRKRSTFEKMANEIMNLDHQIAELRGRSRF